MEHLGWGLQMTVLGMGLVFALLALLWGLLTLVLKLDREPEQPATREEVAEEAEQAIERAEGRVGGQVPGVTTVHGMDADLVAAVMVAVLRHKAERREVAAASARSHGPGSLLYASRWVGAGRSRQTRSWQPKGR
jgi:Na+-transporting methylmalonyl-CoA/oxaloacetate decarboxylase gamma subunit